MPERRKWTKEDDILALDLYFRAPNLSAANPDVCRAAEIIETTPASMAMRAKHFAALNHLHSGAMRQNVANLSREVWAEYCRDERWMLWQLKRAPECDFREACRDIARLRRDANAIIRRRAPPANVPRREARRAAVHSLYAAEMQNIAAAEALSQLGAAANSARGRAVFSDSLPRAVAAVADARSEEIARQIAAVASRAPERISAVESAILRAAVAELLLPRREGETPPVNVVINEAVELAKEFGAEGGYKIVNGALDKIAARLQKDDARK